ncbi:MAG: Sulfate/thiosulfate import ATP-binding protein CysA [Verrucomicrobiota bacterium]|jgi:ABC-type sugar transport system ATPase subunit
MISLRHITLQAGSFQLRDLSMEIPAGSHTALMGRTGSGKTTLLEGVCGLRSVRSGSIWIGGREVTTLPPGERGIGFVPQDGALFDHLTVRQHLEFALEVRGWAPERREARSRELAEWLGLSPLLDRLPAGMSGGERQRVALGRALAFHPPVLCLDEPLSALDDQTRGEIVAVLCEIRNRTGITILHITHNRSEAERLADRILHLRDGRLES